MEGRVAQEGAESVKLVTFRCQGATAIAAVPAIPATQRKQSAFDHPIESANPAYGEGDSNYSVRLCDVIFAEHTSDRVCAL